MDLCLEPVDFKLLDLSINHLVKKGSSIPERRFSFRRDRVWRSSWSCTERISNREDALCKARWPEGFQCPA